MDPLSDPSLTLILTRRHRPAHKATRGNIVKYIKEEERSGTRRWYVYTFCIRRKGLWMWNGGDGREPRESRGGDKRGEAIGAMCKHHICIYPREGSGAEREREGRRDPASS